MILKESYRAAISYSFLASVRGNPSAPCSLLRFSSCICFFFQPSLSTLDRKVWAQCHARCEHCVASSASACFRSYSAFLGEFILDETHLKPVQHSNPEAVIHHYSVWFPSHSFTLFSYVLFTTGKSCTFLSSISRQLHLYLLKRVFFKIQLVSSYFGVYFFCLCSVFLCVHPVSSVESRVHLSS